MSRYQAIVFDVGGTLIGFVDSEPFQRFLAELWRGSGREATESDGRALRKRVTEELRLRRGEAVGLGADAEEIYRLWLSLFEAVFTDMDVGLEPKQAAHRIFPWFARGEFERLFDDVVPALEALQRRGLTLGILSNFPPTLEDILQRLGVHDYFEFFVVSSIVGVAKPAPRIFELGVQAAGCPADRILYVGDHPEDDVLGAQRAGLDAVLIDRSDRYAGAEYPRVRRLTELEELVG